MNSIRMFSTIYSRLAYMCGFLFMPLERLFNDNCHICVMKCALFLIKLGSPNISI